jgi:hypothetical protein
MSNSNAQIEAASYYQLELPPALQARYDAIRDSRLSAEFFAKSRERLAARGCSTACLVTNEV